MKTSIKVKELIKQAKDKYPISAFYKGNLTEEEIIEIEKECEIHCFSVYMNGSGAYNIRYKNER